MWELLKKLQAKRDELAAQIKAMADKPDADNWQANWDKLNGEYDANKAELDKTLTAVQAEQAKAKAIQDRMTAIGVDAQAGAMLNLGRDNGRLGDSNATIVPIQDRSKLFATAMQGWLAVPCENAAELITDEHRAAARAVGLNLAASNLTIRLGRTDEVRALASKLRFQNALTTIDLAGGGALFGSSFVSQLELAMSAYGGMLRVAEIIRTATGVPLSWPTGDDTSNTGEQVSESQTVDGSTEPTFAQQVWNAYKMSSKMVKVPYELLRDSAFSLEGIISSMLGERLGRIQNTKFTTGDGAATPRGIVTAATAGVTSAASTAIAADELLDLEHTINPARRTLGCSWMFNDAILKAIRKLKDGEGRYMWQRGIEGTAPDTIQGYPYTINQDMASSIASGNVTMLFGQMSQYKVRQVASLRLIRLNERYAELDQVAFVAFLDCDGDLLDAGDHPVKKLTQV